MRRQEPFDEVMIVNPSETNSDQRVRLMRFHNIYTPEVGGYAGADPYGYYGQPEQVYGYGYTDPTYGYYGQPEQVYGYGYYGEPEQVYGYGYYGEPEQIYGYGHYGQPEQIYGYGYYGQPEQIYGYSDPTYGYYGQAQEPTSWDGYGYYGDYRPEDVGYYADEYPVGEYPDPTVMGYGQAPEMVGYGEPEPYVNGYPGVGYSGESDYSGYVREVQPAAFNAGCPVPTNVSGLDGGGLDGFVRPRTVNPTCDRFIEQPGSPTLAPDTFKPLW
jgi:hypothetical protein